MSFSNVADLKKYIEKRAVKILAKEVADVVRSVQKEAIKKEVYSVYPRTVRYERRKGDGGLSDEDNMLADIQGTVLRIRNVTQPNDEYDFYDAQFADDGCERSYVFDLPALIEYGDAGSVGYTHKHSSMPSGPTFLEPRPFVARTKEELRRHGYHVNALRHGLMKAGFKVE